PSRCAIGTRRRRRGRVARGRRLGRLGTRPRAGGLAARRPRRTGACEPPARSGRRVRARHGRKHRRPGAHGRRPCRVRSRDQSRGRDASGHGATAGAGVAARGRMASHAVPVLRAASGLVALAAIAASSGAAPPARRSAVAGDLDFTFGRSGQVTTDISDDDEAFAIVAQPDGKLVAAGRAGGQFALVRYDRDGTLDPIFGRSGRVTTTFAGDAEALALVLQPDGKLVAAGRAGTELALARYEPDGTLDPFFGRSGRVRTAFSGNASALAIALDADGKLVVAGRDGGRFAVARYDADGLLDVFFGTGGEVTTAFAGDDVAFAVALDCDGSLVAAGRAAGDGGSRFALARYDRRGVLDPFFGTGGQATATFSGRDEARALLP